MIYTWLLAPAIITFLIYIRFIVRPPDYVVIAGKPNIIPELHLPTQLSFHPDGSVTFENGTTSSEPFFIKRAEIPREFEGETVT